MIGVAAATHYSTESGRSLNDRTQNDLKSTVSHESFAEISSPSINSFDRQSLDDDYDVLGVVDVKYYAIDNSGTEGNVEETVTKSNVSDVSGYSDEYSVLGYVPYTCYASNDLYPKTPTDSAGVFDASKKPI